MSRIPREVLSEHLQQRVKGRAVKAGVFLTFRFDPGFFEHQILPVLLDIPLSQEPVVRLHQLDDALRDRNFAVYYDARALTGEESGKLDVRRIPISWPQGYFHPKNILLLVENVDENKKEEREQKLIVATLSANLTEAGWWRNVEVCHVEELCLDEKSSLRADLLSLISRVKRASPPTETHEALEAIRRFILQVDARAQSTWGQVLHPRLYTGVKEGGSLESVSDFLDDWLRQDLQYNLEVIVPYFDETDATPLLRLIEKFKPKEVRVFLPRDVDGSALCRDSYFDTVRKLPNTFWGSLPKDLLVAGSARSATPRTVHAKVYRFFSANPKYEALFMGSVNLTTAAHSKGGNLETAFLIEPELKQAPDWWLSKEGKRPTCFKQDNEEQGLSQGPGSRLILSYSWDTGESRALWNHSEPSPPLGIKAQGALLFELGALRPLSPTLLDAQKSDALRALLRSTSLLTIEIDGHEPALILVQEDGMEKKPSILLNLSVSDILRCWAALTPEQKAVLLEGRYEELVKAIPAHMLKEPLGRLQVENFFDAFAGIFHAFGGLERNVFNALEQGREKELVYLLFGEKYDSLPRLLARVIDEEKGLDAVTRYVILLCARQLLTRVAREGANFWSAHRQQFRGLEGRLNAITHVREALAFSTEQERRHFLDWYERWFLAKARPLESAR